MAIERGISKQSAEYYIEQKDGNTAWVASGFTATDSAAALALAKTLNSGRTSTREYRAMVRQTTEIILEEKMVTRGGRAAEPEPEDFAGQAHGGRG